MEKGKSPHIPLNMMVIAHVRMSPNMLYILTILESSPKKSAQGAQRKWIDRFLINERCDSAIYDGPDIGDKIVRVNLFMNCY